MRPFNVIIILVVSLAFMSCQTDLDFHEVIDQKSDFTLTVMTADSETGLGSKVIEEIKVNSEKWVKFFNFIEDNTDGWKSSPASHIGDIYIAQGDFLLIHTKGSDGVVIVFMDNEGKPKQYSKKIQKGELDFLWIK